MLKITVKDAVAHCRLISCAYNLLYKLILDMDPQGQLPTEVNSLVKMNGLQTRLTSALQTTRSDELCLNATF